MAGTRWVLLVVGLGLRLRREVVALAFARTIRRARRWRLLLHRWRRSHPRPAVQLEGCPGRLRCSLGRRRVRSNHELPGISTRKRCHEGYSQNNQRGGPKAQPEHAVHPQLERAIRRHIFKKAGRFAEKPVYRPCGWCGCRDCFFGRRVLRPARQFHAPAVRHLKGQLCRAQGPDRIGLDASLDQPGDDPFGLGPAVDEARLPAPASALIAYGDHDPFTAWGLRAPLRCTHTASSKPSAGLTRAGRRAHISESDSAHRYL